MERLKKVISETFSISPENIDENIIFHDLAAWDSFSHMVFIVAVEREFEIELTADEIVKMQSYNEVAEILLCKNLILTDANK